VAEGVLDVYRNALVQEEDDQEDVAVEGADVQRVVALVVGYERVGAVLQEEVDSVVVAPLGRRSRRPSC
jgi:hypothetical protein